MAWNAAVSSPLAAHQVSLGGPHHPAWCCRPLQRQIACSSATCANVPFRFRLCITRAGGSGSPGGIRGSSACLRPVCSRRDRCFPVHKRRCCSLTNCLAASSLSTACQFAAHAAQWQDGTAGVLTAERPASPKTPRKLDLAELGLAELFAASRRGGVQQDRCCIGLEDVQLG